MRALLLLLIFAGCTSQKSVETPTPTPLPSPALASYSWEKGHPERSTWTEALRDGITSKFGILDGAKDMTIFCPPYRKLTQRQRVDVMGETLVWVMYFESGWNPEASSVDVGEKGNKDTWSVGLLQLSVVDQVNYGFKYGYDFKGLQDPIKNMNLGIAILTAQVAKHEKIAIPKGETGLYWSTIHPGGKYDKTNEIAAKVKALEMCK